MNLEKFLKKHDNLPIGKKLMRAFKDVASTTLIAAIVSVCLVGLMMFRAEYELKHYGLPQGSIGKLGMDIQKMNSILGSLVFTIDKTEINEGVTQLEEIYVEANELINEIGKTNKSKAEKEKIEELIELQKVYEDKVEVLIGYISANNTPKAMSEYKEIKEMMISAEEIISSLLDIKIDLADSYGRWNNIIGIVGIVVLVVLILFSFRITKKISAHYAKSFIHPIEELAEVANEISKGNFDVEIEVKNDDEIGALANSFINMSNTLKEYISEISEVLGNVADGDLNVKTEKEYLGQFIEIKSSLDNIVSALNGVLKEIKSSANDVTASSTQVASTAQNLADGAVEQTTQIEQLSDNMNSMNNQIQKSVENASETNNIINRLVEAIEHGNKQMTEMLNAMSEIEVSSNNISNIIKTIEDIADQTNLLALNAAIEAARAGEAGKGFAVVADEVRGLASQSTVAVSESTELIKKSIDVVGKGKIIAEGNAENLLEIIKEMSKATNYINDITKAAELQAEEMEKINNNVRQIASVVEQNSATAEESAAASEELTAQAEVVSMIVDDFKLME